MDLRDVQGRAYRIPSRRLRPFLVPVGGSRDPEALLAGLPSAGQPLRILLGEGRIYAVPESMLAGYERPAPPEDPLQDLLARGRRLIEEGDRLLQEQVVLTPTDLEALYPAEMAEPQVARIHRYYLERDPFAAFHSERDRLLDTSFTYGQTAVPALFRALRAVGAGPRDRFLDLGCGCGAAVLCAASLVGVAEGVDLVPAAVAFSEEAARDLGFPNAAFRVQDGRTVDLARYTIVYLAATAFSDELCAQLAGHLRSAPAGTRVISVSRPFRGGRLEDLGQDTFLFSWTGYGEPCPVEFYYSEVSDATTTQ